MVKDNRVLGAGIPGRESRVLVGEKAGGEQRAWERFRDAVLSPKSGYVKFYQNYM